MTVIVLSKDSNNYYITGDGRSCAGDEVISDNCIKVHKGKDYIVGFCGLSGDEVPILEAINRVQDPFKLLQLLKTDEFKDLFTNFGVLVATKKYGCYEVYKELASGDKDTPCCVVRVNTNELPYLIGSGSSTVRAFLKADGITFGSDAIELEIIRAAELCNSIGGMCTTVSLKVK